MTAKDVAVECFTLIDWIVGTFTGGVEAPRILLSVDEPIENEVHITWKHPETCGLSDCRYHYNTYKRGSDVLYLKTEIMDALAMTDMTCTRKELKKFMKECGLRKVVQEGGRRNG